MERGRWRRRQGTSRALCKKGMLAAHGIILILAVIQCCLSQMVLGGLAQLLCWCPADASAWSLQKLSCGTGSSVKLVCCAILYQATCIRFDQQHTYIPHRRLLGFEDANPDNPEVWCVHENLKPPDKTSNAVQGVCCRYLTISNSGPKL